MKTILRRVKRSPEEAQLASHLLIDEGRFQASWREQPLELTPAEFRLLKTGAGAGQSVFARATAEPSV